MRKSVTVLIAASILSTPAFAQVRPQDCRPVLPVVDRTAEVLPQDLVAERAVPAAVAKRGFFGLPLLPLLLAAGGIAAATGGGGNGGGGTVSPG